MIRTLVIAAAIAAPGAAFAQDSVFATGRLEIAGIAPNACVIRTAGGGVGANAVFEPTSTSSGRIRIVDLVDPATAQSRGATMDLTVPVICNGPHRVTLRSGNGGLRREGAATGGPFASTLPYTYDLVWAGNQSSASSDAGAPLVIDATGARAGQLSLSVNVARGGQPLVAGTYADQIVLEFQSAN